MQPSRLVPHAGQMCQRAGNLLNDSTPQPEQACELNGMTPTLTPTRVHEGELRWTRARAEARYFPAWRTMADPAGRAGASFKNVGRPPVWSWVGSSPVRLRPEMQSGFGKRHAQAAWSSCDVHGQSGTPYGCGPPAVPSCLLLSCTSEPR
jgi:hypothetical protein